MFVKWSRRSRPYKPAPPGQPQREPHRTLVAQLLEKNRRGNRPKQRVVAHLGTCREPVETLAHRVWFYERCETVLDRLDLASGERIKIAAMLDTHVPRPTVTEVAAYKRRLTKTSFRPDGFAALMMAWSAASNAERQRFLDEMEATNGVWPRRPRPQAEPLDFPGSSKYWPSKQSPARR